MDSTTAIKQVINTLNTIPVAGKQNLDRLLGCIMVLEKVVEATETPATPEPSDGKDDVT